MIKYILIFVYKYYFFLNLPILLYIYEIFVMLEYETYEDDNYDLIASLYSCLFLVDTINCFGENINNEKNYFLI